MNIKKSSLVIRNITLDLHRSSLNQSVELLRMKGQNSKSEEKNGGVLSVIWSRGRRVRRG